MKKNKNTESHRWEDHVIELFLFHWKGAVSMKASLSQTEDETASPLQNVLVKLKKYRTTSASHHVKHAMYAAVVASVHP